MEKQLYLSLFILNHLSLETWNALKNECNDWTKSRSSVPEEKNSFYKQKRMEI